ncbi:choice-of-anchor P family protein [Actinoplanes sp. NPDC049596]|uniref:choice-of-anchor P family protein n=1 Tax=unclassified Actinoplanes TaxID=2626549 RepID=UPI0034138D09
MTMTWVRPVLRLGVAVLIGTTASAVGPGSARAALPAGCAQSGSTVTCTYGYTGSEQTFTVPAGVQSVQVTATGAAGGKNSNGLTGGRGATVAGTLSGLTAGTTLYVEVGQYLETATAPNGLGSGTFNGGGAGVGHASGAGGGASDVRTVSGGGNPATTGLASRLIVAAGGGGAGVSDESGNSEGGDAGADGRPLITSSEQQVKGGQAGTQSAGGSGYSNGMLGRGADGYQSDLSSGGGGGGLYGGGSGTPTGFVDGWWPTAAGGGGGGSSLVPAGGTGPNLTSAPASVTISYTAAPAVLQFDAHAYVTRAVPGAATGKADLTCTATAGTVSTTAPAGAGSSRATGAIAQNGLRTATATATVLKAQNITTQGITVTTTATQTANGQVTTTGTATLKSTKVNGISVPANPAPNTTLPLPGGSLVLNEQIPLANGLSVNAIHLRFGSLEAIIGHAATSLTAVGSACPAS